MALKAKNYIKNHFSNSDILFTNSGRSGLQAIIEDFRLQDSKMILPSFICSDVFSTLFLQNNIEPILVDCPKDSFNVTFRDIKKAYNSCKNKGKIKSVLVLHTFGLVNKDVPKIAGWCKRKKLVLIEDCAHSINVPYKGKFVGTFGDAASISVWKIMQLPLGGCYIKNAGKIGIRPITYKLNNLDIYRCVRFIPFGRQILDFLKFFKVKKKVMIDPSKIEIIPAPKLFDFFIISSRKVDIAQRRKYASFLYLELKKSIPRNIPPLDLENNFFHSIPLLVENRDKIYVALLNKKINCGKMWDNPLSKDPSLLKRWRLAKTPNVDSIYSKKIINILIDDPKFNENNIRKKARIISSIVKKFGN